MVRAINDLYSPFSICMSAVSLFLVSYCPSNNGADLNECLRVAVFARSQCTIILSMYRCPPRRFCFVLLNCNCSLSSVHSAHLHWLGHHF